MKQRIALFGMVAVALIFAACGGDSGNNGTETEGTSSSSGEISSSSSVVACSNAYGTNTVTDCRDGQTYKTVVIGTQTWMAENLNYAVDSSWCYENSADSCAKYGRLYQWAAAMGADTSYNSTILGDSVNHQGACPSGWHLPRSSEWVVLVDSAGGEDTAGAKLRSTSGWSTDPDGDDSLVPGTDAYGFSALPAGVRYTYGSFHYAGGNANFWSATEYNAVFAYEMLLGFDFADMYSVSLYKSVAFSVRCLKDF